MTNRDPQWRNVELLQNTTGTLTECLKFNIIQRQVVQCVKVQTWSSAGARVLCTDNMLCICALYARSMHYYTLSSIYVSIHLYTYLSMYQSIYLYIYIYLQTHFTGLILVQSQIQEIIKQTGQKSVNFQSQNGEKSQNDFSQERLKVWLRQKYYQ